MSACVQCFILLVSDSITCLGNSLHIQPIRLFSSAKKLVKMLRTCARVRICWPGFSALWQTHKIFRSCLSHPHERTTYVLLECVYAHMVSCTRPQTICRNIRASSLDFHPWRITHCLAQGWCDEHLRASKSKDAAQKPRRSFCWLQDRLVPYWNAASSCFSTLILISLRASCPCFFENI